MTSGFPPSVHPRDAEELLQQQLSPRWDPFNKAVWGWEQPGCSPGVSPSPAAVYKGSTVLVAVSELQVDTCVDFQLPSWKQRLWESSSSSCVALTAVKRFPNACETSRLTRYKGSSVMVSQSRTKRAHLRVCVCSRSAEHFEIPMGAETSPALSKSRGTHND